jgi:hypothetical protein
VIQRVFDLRRFNRCMCLCHMAIVRDAK